MNASTRNGGAWGFTLHGLAKLKMTKGTDGSSLLSFIVQTIEKQAPDARQFLQELQHIQKASRVEVSFVCEEVKSINMKLQQLESEIQRCEKEEQVETEKDCFLSVMKEFYNSVFFKGDLLEDRFNMIDDLFQHCCTFFGEDPSVMTCEDLLSLFADFLGDWAQAEGAIAEQKSKAQREQRQVEMEKEREQIKNRRRSLKVIENRVPGVVDSLLGNLRGRDSIKISEIIRRRRRQQREG